MKKFVEYLEYLENRMEVAMTIMMIVMIIAIAGGCRQLAVETCSNMWYIIGIVIVAVDFAAIGNLMDKREDLKFELRTMMNKRVR